MAKAKAPEFFLDTSSVTPWEHWQNETDEQRLVAAQRVLGILSTKKARQEHPEYDEALKAKNAPDDVELVALEADAVTMKIVKEAIDKLKRML